MTLYRFPFADQIVHAALQQNPAQVLLPTVIKLMCLTDEEWWALLEEDFFTESDIEQLDDLVIHTIGEQELRRLRNHLSDVQHLDSDSETRQGLHRWLNELDWTGPGCSSRSRASTPPTH